MAQEPVLPGELIGLIYEYQESVDLMFVRLASVIRSDGTLDAQPAVAPDEQRHDRRGGTDLPGIAR